MFLKFERPNAFFANLCSGLCMVTSAQFRHEPWSQHGQVCDEVLQSLGVHWHEVDHRTKLCKEVGIFALGKSTCILARSGVPCRAWSFLSLCLCLLLCHPISRLSPCPLLHLSLRHFWFSRHLRRPAGPIVVVGVLSVCGWHPHLLCMHLTIICRQGILFISLKTKPVCPACRRLFLCRIWIGWPRGSCATPCYTPSQSYRSWYACRLDSAGRSTGEARNYPWSWWWTKPPQSTTQTIWAGILGNPTDYVWWQRDTAFTKGIQQTWRVCP